MKKRKKLICQKAKTQIKKKTPEVNEEEKKTDSSDELDDEIPF